jgi:hypothetical protein
MLVGESYESRSARPGESLRAASYLLLLPLIVTALTVGFLGYSVWRLAYLSWHLICHVCRAVRSRYTARAAARATTYP